MLFERPRENDYVINIGSGAMAVRTENLINLTLNICRRIFVTHNCNIEALLPSSTDNGQFMPIWQVHSPLIIKWDLVNNGDVKAIADRKNNISL